MPIEKSCSTCQHWPEDPTTGPVCSACDMNVFSLWEEETGKAQTEPPKTAVEDQHDAGGSVKTVLPDGMIGVADFSPCGRYRHWLYRSWTSEGEGDKPSKPGFALWIGMNPSTATAELNDPTITREIGFTKTLFGLNEYVKMNVGDYRATNPDDMVKAAKEGVSPCSPGNLAKIVEVAQHAHAVVLACGHVPVVLQDPFFVLRIMLKNAGVKTWCLGTTKDGWPKHPLYLAKTTTLQPFPTDAGV